MSTSRVVIAGAGLGGLRAAESLFAGDGDVEIIVVGDEPHRPYNRPPLSKEALKDGINLNDISGLEFRRRSTLDGITWRLGVPVTSANLTAGHVTLADGEVLDADGLVIATGIRPRRFDFAGPTTGRHVLRTVADAHALRHDMLASERILILGAGFIGCEVAATARALGLAVDVVAIDPVPMWRPLGEELGGAMQRRHEAHGITFHLGRSIAHFTGEERVTGAVLDDGTTITADVVLEAVGSVPNTEWLEGNTAIDLSDGVLVDSHMQVIGSPRPAVAVGDIARFANPLFDNIPRRIEHWNLPTETGRRAGATLVTLLRGDGLDSSPFTPMPSFWSDQHEHRLQSFGVLAAGDRTEFIDGAADDPCIVGWFSGERLVGVVGIDRTADLAPYRKQIAEGT
jgi:3-phenylpropionate/trans-cinnamate dioxygenase ferredoxin reductase component